MPASARSGPRRGRSHPKRTAIPIKSSRLQCSIDPFGLRGSFICCFGYLVFEQIAHLEQHRLKRGADHDASCVVRTHQGALLRLTVVSNNDLPKEVKFLIRERTSLWAAEDDFFFITGPSKIAAPIFRFG